MSFLEGFPVGAVSVYILGAYLEQRGDDVSPVEQASEITARAAWTAPSSD